MLGRCWSCSCRHRSAAAATGLEAIGTRSRARSARTYKQLVAIRAPFRLVVWTRPQREISTTGFDAMESSGRSPLRGRDHVRSARAYPVDVIYRTPYVDLE